AKKGAPDAATPSLNFCCGEGKGANSLRSDSPLPFSFPQQKFKAPHRARAKQTICALALLRKIL
ncbi:hypothetical protein ACQCSJ_27025, partial [Ralstonia pseudosolanacearum]